MTARQAGLGRGLSALISTAAPGQSGLLTLELGQIVANPRQPRTGFDDEALRELAASLRQVGMLQPIVVRPVSDGRYEIVAGERRFRAARLAGLREVPALVRHTEDDQLLTEALIENIHRADLSPLEEAAAYDQLLGDFAMTHDQLAERLGRSRSTITNTLRLLALPMALQEQVAGGLLTAGHARALLGLDGAPQQVAIGRRVVAEGLSVRATEELVRAQQVEDPERRSRQLARERRRRSPYRGLERSIGDALGTQVAIKGTAKRGRVVIEFSGPEDLERLVEILGNCTGSQLRDELPR